MRPLMLSAAVICAALGSLELGGRSASLRAAEKRSARVRKAQLRSARRTKTPLTYSETMLDEYAVNIVAKFGDKVINKGMGRVAPDGKTMRVDVASIDRDGKETSFFLVFKRIG